EVLCYRCNKKGHFANECNMNKIQRKEVEEFKGKKQKNQYC
ncbi:hypothetical protein H311_04592, partial [Anncaliia algerae PRA109]